MKNVAPYVYERAHNAQILYDLVRKVSGKPIVVDSSKDPHRMKLLYLLRPESTRIIFLTRDGRGVMYSYMNRVGLSAAQAAKAWRRGNRYAMLMLRTVRDGDYLHIRYEELCRSPERTLKTICGFLGLDYADMLSFKSCIHHNIGGNRMRLRREECIIEDMRWRKELSEEDLSAFDQIAGDLNRRLLGEYFV